WLSIFGSMRHGTVRLAISSDSTGLFPLAAQLLVMGMWTTSDLPSMRSVHDGAVIALLRGPESRQLRRLSIKMVDAPMMSCAVILLRHSSSSLASAVVGTGIPVAG